MNVRCACLRSYVAPKSNGPDADEPPTVQVPAQFSLAGETIVEALWIAVKLASRKWTYHNKNQPQRRLRRSPCVKTATLFILGRPSQVDDNSFSMLCLSIH